MNGKDLIAVLEYAKAFKDKPEKTRRSKKRDFEITDDPIALLRREMEKAKHIEAFLKDYEKLNKKEDDKKKDEKKSMRSFTFAEGVIIAYLAQFVLGPLYQAYIASINVVH